MRNAGVILLILASLAGVATGLFIILLGPGLGADYDPEKVYATLSHGGLRLGLGVLLFALAILALRTGNRRLPGILTIGFISGGLLTGLATKGLVPPFDWITVILALLAGTVILLGEPRAAFRGISKSNPT
jgi:hypothetical protein